MNTAEYPDCAQYLTFYLGEGIYALNIAKVREVIDCCQVTQLPEMATYMKGIINLRGDVVPVVGLREKLVLDSQVKAQPGCVVIADIQCDGKSLTIGALVDSVDQVVEITSETIRGAPEVGCHGAKQVIDGIGEVGGEFVVLLDIDQVFADGELHSVQQQAHNSTGSYTRGMAV